MSISTESTFEYVFFFNFYSFGAFGDFVSDLSTVITNIIGRLMFKQIFIQQFRLLKILLHKYLRMMIGTFPSLFTVTIHIIPTQFTNDMFIFTRLSQNTESHIIVGTAFIHMSKLTMISFCALIFHKLLTYLDIMTEITFITIGATALIFKFITRFDFTSVMKVGTGLATFAMNKLFADTIFGELMRIGDDGLVLIEVIGIVEFIIVSGSLSVVVEVVHLMYDCYLKFI